MRTISKYHWHSMCPFVIFSIIYSYTMNTDAPLLLYACRDYDILVHWRVENAIQRNKQKSIPPNSCNFTQCELAYEEFWNAANAASEWRCITSRITRITTGLSKTKLWPSWKYWSIAQFLEIYPVIHWVCASVQARCYNEALHSCIYYLHRSAPPQREHNLFVVRKNTLHFKE